jgi:hypothetical protein
VWHMVWGVCENRTSPSGALVSHCIFRKIYSRLRAPMDDGIPCSRLYDGYFLFILRISLTHAV